MDNGEMPSDGTIIISGTVSELDTHQHIEGVKIVFKAKKARNNKSIPSADQNVYTDSKGTFRIESSGYSYPVICSITTEHEDSTTETKEIVINWNGTSYEEEAGTFFVNECDFFLKAE